MFHINHLYAFLMFEARSRKPRFGSTQNVDVRLLFRLLGLLKKAGWTQINAYIMPHGSTSRDYNEAG